MPLVSIFVTCVIDQLFPKVGIAMADVLERAGCSVEFRQDQTCCGQPAFNSGYRAEPPPGPRHFLKVFDGAEYIVVPSGSCTSMVSHHFADIFADFPSELAAAHALEPKVYEFSSFLTNVLNVDDVGARFDGVVTYHDS